MAMVRRGEVTDIAITEQDRLTRLGFGYLEEFFSGYGVRIHVVDGQEDRQSVQRRICRLIGRPPPLPLCAATPRFPVQIPPAGPDVEAACLGVAAAAAP